MRWILIAALAVLVGCGPYIKSGTVVDKNHCDEWMQLVYYGDGQWMPVFHPEVWSVKIRSGEAVRWVSVPECDYHSLAVGDYYNTQEEEAGGR